MAFRLRKSIRPGSHERQRVVTLAEVAVLLDSFATVVTLAKECFLTYLLLLPTSNVSGIEGYKRSNEKF